MSRRRVVITGMGMLTPLGTDVSSSWQGILEGRSGIGPIEHMDLSAYTTRFGGSVKGFNVEDYIPGKEARHMDGFIHFGLAAAIQAGRDAEEEAGWPGELFPDTGLDLIVQRTRALIAVALYYLITGSWAQVLVGMDSRSPVMNYPLAVAAAGTLVMGGCMAVLLLLQSWNELRGHTPPDAGHTDEGAQA